MFLKDTVSLLQKSLPVLPHLVGGSSFKYDIDDLVAGVFSGMKLAVIDDRSTAEAFGDQVARALKTSMHITLDKPAADMSVVYQIWEQTKQADALIAVGSGSINDICKYAAAKEGKPYAVFPTAASMNGYCSANASLTVNGYKKTMPAKMPQAVWCDWSVIAAAPARLNKSGVGDSLARPTAQADWLLSHLLLATPYNELPYELLAPYEPQLFATARGIPKSDPASVELLMQVLLLSGLGMSIAGGSYPASQGEHMIAHAYDMMRTRPPSPATFHGEEIGVTTLTMAQMQEQLLRHVPHVKREHFDAEGIEDNFGPQIKTEAEKAFAEKEALMENTDISRWEAIAERIEAISLPPALIRAVLDEIEAPTSPEALGWSPLHYAQALAQARYLRERFTFLDIV